MKKAIYYLLIATIFIAIGWLANIAYHMPKSPTNPISQVKPRPLEKYSIENLANTEIKPAQIKMESDNLFSFIVDSKKVTGQINIPKGNGPFPVIVMFRGYIDQKTYETGDGTRRAAELFAQNGFTQHQAGAGFITIAPDFLGYGGSDQEADSIFESRFQTYTTALVLLKSLGSLEKWDKTNAFIWGHSNGGQIALTILEITGINYPTVLWAPVSKPFPYSILYYTDESDDRGKMIRKELSKFEEDYDVEKYSLTNYLDRIKAPIQLHQGTADDAVPIAWSDTLVKNLEALGSDITYIKHPGADHNMQPAWNTVVQQDLTFYKKMLHY